MDILQTHLKRVEIKSKKLICLKLPSKSMICDREMLPNGYEQGLSI